MEWVEKTAKSVEEAKEAALDALGVHEDDAEFEVVTEAKTGLFGRVKEDARVRARVQPTTPRSKEDGRRKRGRGGNSRSRNGKGGQGRENRGESRGDNKSGGDNQNKGGSGRQQDSKGGNKPAAEQKNRQGGGQKTEKKQEKSENMYDEPSMPLPQQADMAENFVTGLAEVMGANVSFAREDVADDEIRITVSGENLGRMIGPRGGTAMAVDDLVRTVLQRHGTSRDGRIRIDIGGLKARRTTALVAFCRAEAAAVREDGMARVLDPMGGAERKIVHDTIAEEDGVDTASEGEDPNRCVIIVPAGDAG